MSLSKSQALFELTYLKADPNTLAFLDGFILSANNYIMAGYVDDRNVDQFVDSVYDIGVQMANPDYVAPAAVLRNSNRDPKVDANQLANLYTRQNKRKTVTSTTSPASSKWISYRWDDGWDSHIDFGDETLEDKILYYASNIYKNLGRAVGHLNANPANRVYGIKEGSENTYKEAYNKLGEFITNTAGKKADFSTLKQLAKIVENVGIDRSQFLEYFRQYLPTEDPMLRAKAGIERLGYTPIDDVSTLGYNQDVMKYLGDKYKFARDKEGNVYAFNSDYSAPALLEYLNTDWRQRGLEGSTYNHGIFTNPNGKVWYGNYNDLNSGDEFYDAISNYRDQVVSGNKGKFKIYNDFNKALNYTDGSKAVHDFVNRLGAAANLKHSLNNFVDVSELFNSRGLVIAVNDNGDPFSDEGLETGALEFKPDTWFFYVDKNGELAATQWGNPELEQKIGKYNPGGWNETSNQVGSTLKGILFSNTSTITGDAVGEDVQGWANKMLDTLSKGSNRTTDDIRFLEQYGSFNNKENALAYISELLSEGKIQLDDDHMKKWHDLTKKYRVNAPIQNAVVTDDDKENFQTQELIEEAKKAGYSSVADYLEYKEANNRKGFSTTEWMRLGALAADIASLGASFAPGYGTIASGVLGVGASGTDFAADIMQDGFQWKDLGTLGVNLGLDFVGLLPGGKSLKITKNAVKVISRTLPLLIGVWSAYADGDKYIAAAKKLVNEDPKNMTAQDWQTLGRGLMLLTGTVRTGKATYGAYGSAGKAVGSGVKKGYNYIAEPIRRDKKAAEIHKERKVQDARGEKRGTGGWKRGQQLTELTLPGTRRNSDPYMVEEKQGGKLDRFGEYLKSYQ